jgi:hypothetical protein
MGRLHCASPRISGGKEKTHRDKTGPRRRDFWLILFAVETVAVFSANFPETSHLWRSSLPGATLAGHIQRKRAIIEEKLGSYPWSLVPKYIQLRTMGANIIPFANEQKKENTGPAHCQDLPAPFSPPVNRIRSKLAVIPVSWRIWSNTISSRNQSKYCSVYKLKLA